MEPPMRTLFALCLALTACVSTTSSDDDGTPPPAGCADIAGVWAIAGSCGADSCTISQADCAITQLTCVSGAHSTSGSVSADQFSYTGVSGGGTPATCTGTASGDSFSGTCNVANVGTCDFSGARR